MLETLSYYKVSLYVVIIVILVTSIVYIVKYFKNSPINNFINSKGFIIEKHSSHASTKIDNQKLLKPTKENSYAFSFWIYMDNFYENMNYWKHVFHKGSLINKNDTIDTSLWKDIEEIVPEQSIGVWMHPNLNNLRIAFTTNNNYTNLEYLDVENIPSNTLVHCLINVKDNFIEFYKNGALLNSKVFKDELLFNDKNLYLTFKKSFDGKLYNLNYIPKHLNFDEIQSLYNKKPKM